MPYLNLAGSQTSVGVAWRDYTMKPAFLLALMLAGATCCAQTSIDVSEAIQIGGIRQYITIKGADRSLPLLLFLHGGPGGSVMPYKDRFTEKLSNHFVIVQWDQRETGKTRQLNHSPVPLTVSVFQNDTRELIDSLLKRFNRQKLYLMGHSWGTALGFHIAKNYPELLYAWLPIGPMIDQLESERMALDTMKEIASRDRNNEALKELSRINVPFENWEQLYYHRKWLLAFSGSRKVLSKTYVRQWATVWLSLFNKASRVDLTQSLPEIRCPVYFFVGRKDYQTNALLAERYYLKLVAPKKGFFWFERSGHGVPTTEPDRMQNLIIERVLPETFPLERARPVAGKSVQ